MQLGGAEHLGEGRLLRRAREERRGEHRGRGGRGPSGGVDVEDPGAVEERAAGVLARERAEGAEGGRERVGGGAGGGADLLE